MLMRLHKLATTTPATRAYIQASRAGVADLAAELGVSETTVRRWRGRRAVHDRSHRPHRLATRLAPLTERLAVELRSTLGLPLDDVVEALRRCVDPGVSRSGIHRCLARHGVAARPQPGRTPPLAFTTAAPAGFVHLDVKYLPRLHKRRAYADVAIDRATRFVQLEILPDRRAATAAGFLARFLAAFPVPVHTVLTDNGSEWTDRFAVDKKGKPPGRPSGDHEVDRLCAARGIEHRLTRPFRPQTNGLVERFNRRLAEQLARRPHNSAGHHRRFAGHADLAAEIHGFVHAYNRTRLRCLDDHAPLELLTNLPGPNTGAGPGCGAMTAGATSRPSGPPGPASGDGWPARSPNGRSSRAGDSCWSLDTGTAARRSAAASRWCCRQPRRRIGWEVDGRRRRQGFGTEIAAAMARFAKNPLGVARLDARCHADNRASRRIMDRLGLRHAGTALEPVLVRSRPWPTARFGLDVADAQVYRDGPPPT